MTDATKDDIQGTWVCSETGRTLEIGEYEIVSQSADQFGAYKWPSYTLEDGVVELTLGRMYVRQSESGMCLEVVGEDQRDGTYTLASEEEPEIEELQIGDTAATDVVEVTVKEFEFTDKVSLDHGSSFYMPTTENRGLVAGDDKVFLRFSFDVKNVSKEEIVETDIVGGNNGSIFQVDYNDGYIFDTGNYSDSDLSSDSKLAYIAPLETREMKGLIKCASEVAEDNGNSVILVITLPTSTGTQIFHYTIR